MSSPQGRRIGRPPVMVNGRSVPERVLEAALELFAEKGFEGTSVQDVVDSAGLTKGAMYHYFTSKDDLLAEIYARMLRMQMSRLQAFVDSDAPLLDRLSGAAADVVVTTIENLATTTIFFRSMHQLNKDQELEVRRQRRRYHETFRQMILEGQSVGVLRGDADPDLVIDFYFGAVHHLPMWWRPGGGLTAEKLGAEFAQMLLDLLRPRA